MNNKIKFIAINLFMDRLHCGESQARKIDISYLLRLARDYDSFKTEWYDTNGVYQAYYITPSTLTLENLEVIDRYNKLVSSFNALNKDHQNTYLNILIKERAVLLNQLD